MRKYIIPKQWKKIDRFTAKAPDGSKAWLNVQGVVGLEQPNGYYISFGASFADSGGDPHNGKLGPPPTNRILRVTVNKRNYWEKDGFDTGIRVFQNIHQILESIKSAMKALGYSIEYRQE